jgi:hypothetical protein
MDANCSRHHNRTSCDARPSTTAFFLEANGIQYRLDNRSNYDAHSLMMDRADKAASPDATKAVPVSATVTGRVRSNGRIRADVIAVQ